MTATAIQLESAHAQGLQRWPGVRLPLEKFAAHVQGLDIDQPRLAEHATDLFLAVAALLGDPCAIELLDDHYLAAAVPAVARIDRSPAFVDDVIQQVRVHLLTGATPRLATYLATGRLLDWVRVTAVRIALNTKRADHRLLPTEDVPLDKLLPETDPEMEALRTRYARELQSALEEGFRALAPRERNLLRLHFLDGLSLDALATMHNVHRATIARWLVSIRRALVERARGGLGGDAGLTSRSVRSLYRWLARDVHLSLSKLLAQELRPASRD
jgi:RNA polymerase sigma-70 factor (ECF subfamily)